jgi:hypothetical protein
LWLTGFCFSISLLPNLLPDPRPSAFIRGKKFF